VQLHSLCILLALVTAAGSTRRRRGSAARALALEYGSSRRPQCWLRRRRHFYFCLILQLRTHFESIEAWRWSTTTVTTAMSLPTSGLSVPILDCDESWHIR